MKVRIEGIEGCDDLFLGFAQQWMSVNNRDVHEISEEAWKKYRRIMDEYIELMQQLDLLRSGKKTDYWT